MVLWLSRRGGNRGAVRVTIGQAVARTGRLGLVAKVGVEGVIADAEHTARPPLVLPAAEPDKPRVPARPCAERVVTADRGHQERLVVTAETGRQIVEADLVVLRQANHVLDDALQLPHVSG